MNAHMYSVHVNLLFTLHCHLSFSWTDLFSLIPQVTPSRHVADTGATFPYYDIASLTSTNLYDKFMLTSIICN